MSYPGYEYPTDAQLKRVREWTDFWASDPKRADYAPWFAFVKTLWWMPDWGWREYDGRDGKRLLRVLHISTGGWSGNEDLMGAMERNFIGWSQSFNTYRNGGHYEFWIPRSPRRSKGGKRGRSRRPTSGKAVTARA